jgi:hypothetical protein
MPADRAPTAGAKRLRVATLARAPSPPANLLHDAAGVYAVALDVPFQGTLPKPEPNGQDADRTVSLLGR